MGECHSFAGNLCHAIGDFELCLVTSKLQKVREIVLRTSQGVWWWPLAEIHLKTIQDLLYTPSIIIIKIVALYSTL